METQNASWVRDLTHATIGTELKSVSISIKKEDYSEESVFANLIRPSVIKRSIIDTFGSEEVTHRAFGKLNLDMIVNDIVGYIWMNAIDTYFTAPEEVVKNEVFEDRKLSLSFMPISFKSKNFVTDRINYDLTWMILIDVPGILYEKDGKKLHYSKHYMGGQYSKLSSISLIDISGYTTQNTTMYHETMHMFVRHLRETLDQCMYGDGADQREEILVHFDTDLQMLKRGIYDMFAGTKFMRDSNFNLNAIHIPNVEYKPADGITRSVDSYNVSGDMSINKSFVQLAHDRGVPTIKKSKNQTIRDAVPVKTSESDKYKSLKDRVDSATLSMINRVLQRKSSISKGGKTDGNR